MNIYSEQLLNKARKLFSNTPEFIANEIVVTGSVSKGLADEFSDVEVLLFTNQQPTIETKTKWLIEKGCKNIVNEDHDPNDDGSKWTTCNFEGVQFEIGWQEYNEEEKLIEKVLNGEILDHWILITVEAKLSSIVIKDGYIINLIIEKLSDLPKKLRDKLISETLNSWITPNVINSRVSSVIRGDITTYYSRALKDINDLNRILLAYNYKWEPDWKRLSDIYELLPKKPQRLYEKVDFILRNFNKDGVEELLTLMIDVFLLIGDNFDTKKQVALVRQALNSNT